LINEGIKELIKENCCLYYFYFNEFYRINLLLGKKFSGSAGPELYGMKNMSDVPMSSHVWVRGVVKGVGFGKG
jgi:hypothetical protein